MVITISSQIFVALLFLFCLFNIEGNNNKVTVVYDENFDKMSDITLDLFEAEQLVVDQDDNSLVVLDDNTIEEKNDGDVEETVNKGERVPLETILETYTGILTGYGPDCAGCGDFNTGKVVTSSGYHVSNIVDGAIEPAFTITYNDYEYGEVRIVAADDSIPFYSIVKITVPNWDEPIIAIVLDRGSTVGFENCRSSRGCLTQFDLLYHTEEESLGKTRNVKFELLRSGK